LNRKWLGEKQGTKVKMFKTGEKKKSGPVWGKKKKEAEKRGGGDEEEPVNSGRKSSNPGD